MPAVAARTASTTRTAADSGMPRSAARAYGKFRPYGFPLIIVLLIALPQLIPGFDPVGSVVVPPVQWLSDHYMGLAQMVAGR